MPPSCCRAAHCSTAASGRRTAGYGSRLLPVALLAPGLHLARLSRVDRLDAVLPRHGREIGQGGRTAAWSRSRHDPTGAAARRRYHRPPATGKRTCCETGGPKGHQGSCPTCQRQTTSPSKNVGLPPRSAARALGPLSADVSERCLHRSPRGGTLP